MVVQAEGVAEPLTESAPDPENRWRDLFRRFRPGQDIDRELDAYDREQAELAASAAVVAEDGGRNPSSLSPRPTSQPRRSSSQRPMPTLSPSRRAGDGRRA